MANIYWQYKTALFVGRSKLLFFALMTMLMFMAN